MSKKTVNTSELASILTPTGVSISVNVGFHHKIVLTQDGKERELSGQLNNEQHFENHIFQSETDFAVWVEENPVLGALAVKVLEKAKNDRAI